MNERWQCGDCGRHTRLNVCLRCHRAEWVRDLRDSLGHCRRCGALLRDPVSRSRHYGPDCWAAVQIEAREAAA